MVDEDIYIPKLDQNVLEVKDTKDQVFKLLNRFMIYFAFVGLLFVIAFLPISEILKVISLLLGSFLLVDIHKSQKIKSYG